LNTPGPGAYETRNEIDKNDKKGLIKAHSKP